MTGIPLGKRGDLRLEFKSAEALSDPETIAREVVAMLNARGGEVWVGLREEDGIAVAVDHVPHPEASRQSLRDFLVDTIEPSPSPEEVELDLVPSERGSLLRLSIKPDPSRKPYALLRRNGRLFWMRIARRLRPMEREEIRRSFQESTPEADELRQAEDSLKSESEALQREASRRRSGIFWLRILPVPPISLDLDALQAGNLLLDPRESGNRRAGKTFFQVGVEPHRRPDRLMLGEGEAAAFSIYRQKGLELCLPLERFHAGHEPRAEKPLHWLALSEMPVSVFRLLSKILQGEAYWKAEPSAPSQLFLCSIALLGLEGWTLRPNSPRTYKMNEWTDYLRQEPGRSSAPDFVLASPLVFTMEEVRDLPDWCGFRVVSRVYEAFGFGASQMPPEFDRKSRRLILSE